MSEDPEIWRAVPEEALRWKVEELDLPIGAAEMRLGVLAGRTILLPGICVQLGCEPKVGALGVGCAGWW